MKNCINCKKEIISPSDTFFCPYCVTQLKCKNCGTELVVDAIGCASCGTLILKRANNGEALNHIEYDQKGDNKKFTASFTDFIGQNLVESLGGLFNSKNNIGIKTNNLLPNKFSTNPTKAINANYEEAVVTVDNLDEENIALVLQQIFRFDEEKDKFIITNLRLKQTTKIDHSIRVSLLLLYAYNLIGRSPIERAILTEALNFAKLNNGNFRDWISKCDEISKIGSDSIELSMPGIAAAKEIIREFLDTNVEKGAIEFSGSSAKRSKRKKTRKSVADGETNADNVTKPSNKNNTKSPITVLSNLIAEGYFSEKRKIGDIVTFIKDNKAVTFSTNELSTPLNRLIKNNQLLRTRNSDNQYEYYKSN